MDQPKTVEVDITPVFVVAVLVVVALAGVALWPKSPPAPPPIDPNAARSPFAALGFSLRQPGDVEALRQQAGMPGTRWDTPGANGAYLQVAAGDGPELWLALDDHDRPLGVTPYFQPTRRNPVRLLRTIADPSQPERGSFAAQPLSASPDQACSAFVFSSPDYRRHTAQVFPADVHLGLTAFTRLIAVYPDAATFADGQQDDPVQFPARSFFPAGLLAERAGVEQQAEVLFSGVVQDGRRLRNALTGQEYVWLGVQTDCLWLDVVVYSPILSTVPARGNVVGVGAWLVGRWE